MQNDNVQPFQTPRLIALTDLETGAVVLRDSNCFWGMDPYVHNGAITGSIVYFKVGESNREGLVIKENLTQFLDLFKGATNLQIDNVREFIRTHRGPLIQDQTGLKAVS